ncbi:MAG: Gfo/Idh/MocA family oxidoreductase [Planctomycetota bacterium]|nr:MAG: Gfo/Idh/MocA family oxidoreductase [Planctomycetota bacterium]
MEQKIRWGIIGTGFIAKKFAEALQVLPEADLIAVGSRAADTAKSFAEAFNIPHQHSSYNELVNDADVDVVYIATPHPYHMENTILCLKARKAVLCEKPFAVNASHAQQMISVAREKQLFLMEGMWTRFLPIIVKVREWLEKELIGPARFLKADFGFKGNRNPKGRLLNPELAGGALLDVGVYTIALASMVFKESPSTITAAAKFGRTGVDEQSEITLNYDKGQSAILSCAIRKRTPQQAVIVGTKGNIRIHSPFWSATTATISIEGKEDETVKMPFEYNGFEYEAREVMRCIEAGQLESNIMPLDESRSIVKTMDEIRAQWGLKYPME